VTLVLSDAEVQDACDMRVLIDAIEHAAEVEARGGVQIVPRINFGIENGFFRLMPAVIEELDVMGLKAFDAKFPEARYLIAVFIPSTGELDCLIDAAYLTAARTGATTGVATRWMTAQDGCLEVGVIGSGLEARTNLEAVLTVRQVERVKIFSPNAERRERFAREAAARFGVEAVAVRSAAEAADAACVIAATNTGANGPVALEGAWLRDGAHLNTIGATAPVLREVDTATFERAAAIVLDTEHADAECGDIIAAKEARTWDAQRIRTLTDVVGSGQPYAREGLTVFKSVGTAVQDLAAAAAVARVARERGVGRELDIVTPKTF
jgi:ornithine cyclodeaminase/alanine dehydrogenase-like protein (mu-crystallin family)